MIDTTRLAAMAPADTPDFQFALNDQEPDELEAMWAAEPEPAPLNPPRRVNPLVVAFILAVPCAAAGALIVGWVL